MAGWDAGYRAQLAGSGGPGSPGGALKALAAALVRKGERAGVRKLQPRPRLRKADRGRDCGRSAARQAERQRGRQAVLCSGARWRSLAESEEEKAKIPCLWEPSLSADEGRAIVPRSLALFTFVLFCF
ncbi:hypothetical protein MPTK1_2g06260 [Marchantia polymorpha subsp. ruderalis]|uniref:Uncharacterized protein n=1 Tax=Marchantia polymorpha TaxID=3197 RepID=A0A2R6XDP5_MARPO|nr:hypothetical protein MARPO_0021s0081 [Marchantia polymorpha]BBN01298.1 hypothetical protein Mp_2g06260 [Marchantia polymorpha subsp. ruderalis]|eukprot:PTQ44223.1 hypothetical protein MARPO_0021s0081 [Marchantia polymorpha]